MKLGKDDALVLVTYIPILIFLFIWADLPRTFSNKTIPSKTLYRGGARDEGRYWGVQRKNPDGPGILVFEPEMPTDHRRHEFRWRDPIVRYAKSPDGAMVRTVCNMTFWEEQSFYWSGKVPDRFVKE